MFSCLSADASHRPKYSSHIKSRCFKSLGCYSIEYPFNNTYFLPDSPRRINTRFWIYPPNSYKKKSLRLDRDYNKIYKASLPTKVIIPGFNPYHENFAWVDEMANELQKTVYHFFFFFANSACRMQFLRQREFFLSIWN